MTLPPEARMERARQYYHDRMGFELVPIEQGGKKPPMGLTGWQERPLPQRLLDDHIRSGAGLGVVHQWSGTATLDADQDEDIVTSALASVGIDFPKLLKAGTPAIIGNPDKPPKLLHQVPAGYTLTRKALAWPKPDGSGREVVFELRAGPAQDVLPPTIHPDFGQPYRWTSEPPQCRDDIPLIPGPLLGLWLAWDRLRPLMEAACPWASPTLPRPLRPTRSRPHEGPSIIAAWNERIPPGEILERNGYKRAGRNRWVAPDSTTGDPGVVVLDDCVFSHHASDIIADGRGHDCFDLLRILEHNGDARDAARSAVLELGLGLNGDRRGAVTVVAGAR